MTPTKNESLPELLTLLARVYADAYQAGHDATVEFEFVDVQYSDRDTYWLDRLRERDDVQAALTREAPTDSARYRFLRRQPVEGGPFGIPRICVPHSDTSGDFVNGEDADSEIDEAMHLEYMQSLSDDPALDGWAPEATPPAPQRMAQGEQIGHITLNQVQKDALYGVMSNLEHDAGDIDDLAPDKEKDEDAYWAYHAWHAINKLRGGDNSHYTTQPPHQDKTEKGA